MKLMICPLAEHCDACTHYS